MALATVGPAWASESSVRDAVGVGNAMWVWQTESLFGTCEKDSPPASCTDAVAELIDFSREHGVHVLWMQVRVDGALEHQEVWRYLIPRLHTLGIDVHALAGHPDWAIADNHGEPQALLQGILDFNEGLEPAARFKGVRFNIEPHNLDPGYATQDLESRGYSLENVGHWREHVGYRVDLFEELMDLLDKLKDTARANDLSIGADVPYWWDLPDWARNFQERGDPEGPDAVSPAGYIGEVRADRGESDGMPEPATYRLIEHFDSVGIMAYRDKVFERAETAWTRWGRGAKNNPGGAVIGGIVPHAVRALHYAEIHNRKVLRDDVATRRRAARIFVGVESKPVVDGEPHSNVTFGDDSYLDLIAAVCRARVEFQYYDSFEGMAFHSYTYLRALRERRMIHTSVDTDGQRRCGIWAQEARGAAE